MLAFPFLLVAFVALHWSAVQAADPFVDILNQVTEIGPAAADEKTTALLKQGYNATHAEIRVKYNYWLQGTGSADGLIAAIDRFHALRLEIEPGIDRRECARQKLAFAREIEKRCPETRSQNKYQALCEIDEAAAKSFRLAAELEFERLSMGVSE
jgi:hypothetical protein